MLGQGEDGQEHGDDDTADDDAEEENDQRLDKGGETADSGINLHIIEISDFDQHLFELSGFLSDGDHADRYQIYVIEHISLEGR